MPSAQSYTPKRKSFLYSKTEPDNPVPPVLRLLLNSTLSRFIAGIEHDYDLLAREKMALAMINDEDSGIRIALDSQPKLASAEGAFIVSHQGRIIGWGKKNPAHPVLHAEASALLFSGKPLPKGARICSTLKPCKMCRALIEHFSTTRISSPATARTIPPRPPWARPTRTSTSTCARA